MPLPRLPRHLRPCRALRSAHQVRFASDKPPGGGDAWTRARSRREGEGRRDDSFGSSSGPKGPAAAAQPAASTQSGTRPGQAQRTRRQFGGGAAAHTTAQPRIHKHWTSRESERIQGAITTYMRKKDEGQQTAPETEAELRERLRKLEGQLARLQQRLEAGTGQTPTQTQAKEAEQAPQAKEALQGKEAPQAKEALQGKEALQAPQAKEAPQAEQPPPPATATTTAAPGEQSLLDELFPEASSHVPPDAPDSRPSRPSPPKLDLPAPDTNPHIRLTPSDMRSEREKAIDGFRARGEHTTVLQLSNCSTALTESDFRRLVPRGLHIESWSRDGHFYKIIPGRDPLSLARLPFYYLLFHTPASALAYQKNASRLSKLSALHAPTSIQSAIMPPAGFLEDGEDIHAVTCSFVLHPHGHHLDLRTVMQPYNRALRALIDAGGYTPIVPNVDDKGKKIHRVLLHIDGYEPSHWDLWQIISRHAHARGILWPFRNEHAGAVRRLRDCINLKTVAKTKFQAVSSSNPRAASPLPLLHAKQAAAELDYEDPTISAFLGTGTASSGAGEADGESSQEINQLVMNRVYNRWIVEFDDEDAARRFAGLWHRVVLPDAKDKTGAWKVAEEERWVEAEYLW